MGNGLLQNGPLLFVGLQGLLHFPLVFGLLLGVGFVQIPELVLILPGLPCFLRLPVGFVQGRQPVIVGLYFRVGRLNDEAGLFVIPALYSLDRPHLGILFGGRLPIQQIHLIGQCLLIQAGNIKGQGLIGFLPRLQAVPGCLIFGL